MLTKGIPFVLIVEDETLKLKDMTSGDQSNPRNLAGNLQLRPLFKPLFFLIR